MATLRLCYECYSWTLLKEGRCADCDGQYDQSATPLFVHEFEEIIGPILGRIGEVRVRRKLLPETGTLYVTENGLYFVPHLLRRRQKIVEKTYAGRSLFWLLISQISLVFVFLHLIFLLFFNPFKNRRVRKEVNQYQPINLPMDDRALFAAQLIEDSGTFFVAQETISRIYRKRSEWVIERIPGKRLQFSPVLNHELVMHRMEALLTVGDWQKVSEM